MKTIEHFAFWAFLILLAALLAMVLSECTCRISKADRTIIQRWRDDWPVPKDTCEQNPFDSTEAAE